MNLVGPLKDVGKQAQGFFRFVHACTHQPAVLGAKTSAGWNPGVYNRGYLSHFYKTPIGGGQAVRMNKHTCTSLGGIFCLLSCGVLEREWQFVGFSQL